MTDAIIRHSFATVIVKNEALLGLAFDVRNNSTCACFSQFRDEIHSYAFVGKLRTLTLKQATSSKISSEPLIKCTIVFVSCVGFFRKSSSLRDKEDSVVSSVSGQLPNVLCTILTVSKPRAVKTQTEQQALR